LREFEEIEFLRQPVEVTVNTSKTENWKTGLFVCFYYLIYYHLYTTRHLGTPTKRQVSKRQVSKHLKRQVYKTSGLQNVRSSKRLVEKKHPYIFCTCG
jgi:hypothetical protein